MRQILMIAKARIAATVCVSMVSPSHSVNVQLDGLDQLATKVPVPKFI